jgi:enoyl-CoA hydratase/carnithine racemase
LKNGLTYEPAFVRRLVRIVGPGPAGLLLYGGERWNASEAAARGLVDKYTVDTPAAVEEILGGLRGADASAVASMTSSLRNS